MQRGLVALTLAALLAGCAAIFGLTNGSLFGSAAVGLGGQFRRSLGSGIRSWLDNPRASRSPGQVRGGPASLLRGAGLARLTHGVGMARCLAVPSML